jgi:MoaA/NifB/PqqE/SkfB family radical SAM enzyme
MIKEYWEFSRNQAKTSNLKDFPGIKRDRMTMVTGIHLALVWIGLTLTIMRNAFTVNRYPFQAIRLLRSLIKVRKANLDNSGKYKALRSGSKYYWSMNIPGWPSEKFNYFIQNEFRRITSPENSTLQSIIFSITNICPYHCVHCYESENLSDKNRLSLSELKCIMDKIRDKGIRTIQFSGGEPMSRFDDMIEMMEYSGKANDYWVSTSGFGLTLERAMLMKKSGMTGVIISLDDWDETRHNHFRGHNKSFYWVLEAVKNAREASLIVCLSLCPVKEFLTAENLNRYFLLAKNLGAGFIRIMEPRDIGRYFGKNVLLDTRQIKMIEDFVITGNCDPVWSDYPIIVFSGYYQRKFGCSGAGYRYLFIDSNGNFHVCPFCRDTLGNILDESLDSAIEKAKASGCHVFQQNKS